MEQEQESNTRCRVCGAEADLIIEGFDTATDVRRVGRLICNQCGAQEDMVVEEGGDDTVKAIALAVQREKEAHLFYKGAAEKTSSQKGKDMFARLAEFELNHYKKMVHLFHSLGTIGRWVSYAGQGALKPPRRVQEGERWKTTMRDDIDVLNMAIQKEEEAQTFYREMAEKTEDPAGQKMFKRLAGEEEVHRRILNDQVYTLSNRGLWVWAE